MAKNSPTWSSSTAFILAAAGAAVGLGNIWKFPYITGENGGGAFVLIYLGCILIIGIPLLMAELMIGRMGRSDPATSLKHVASKANKSPAWAYVGLLGIICSFVILSYYAVITGWVFDYLAKAVSGGLTDLNAQKAQNLFSNLMASPGHMLLWQSIVIAITVFIAIRGLKKGLEAAILFMFPAMGLLLLVLLSYAIYTGHIGKAFYFLFHPHFAKLSEHSILSALGHAFFSLSLAVGTIMMYGAYVPKHISIFKASVIIAIMDTLIALLAGLAIFPIVFSHGLAPDAGPGLIFKTIPVAFSHLPLGSLFAGLFFLTLILAAITSTISLLEPSVVWLIDRFRFSRKLAALSAGVTCWLLGIVTILSFNTWDHVTLFGLTFFNLFDYITAHLLMPIIGLLIAVFASWVISKSISTDGLELQEGLVFKIWRFTLRYLSPLAIIAIFITSF